MSKVKILRREVVALDRLTVHLDADFETDSEDRMVLDESVAAFGQLSPLSVIDNDFLKGNYFIIDGAGRFAAMQRAGMKEAYCDVIDLCGMTVRQFMVERNTSMRKISTGTRIMAHLTLHENEVLNAADPKNYNLRDNSYGAVSHDTAPQNKGFQSKEIADRLHVSNKDVICGIDLLKAMAGDEADATRETYAAVVSGRLPIRRWKSAMEGGKVTVGGRAAANHTAIAYRTMKQLGQTFIHWQEIDMADRARILNDFCKVVAADIPDDFFSRLKGMFGGGK